MSKNFFVERYVVCSPKRNSRNGTTRIISDNNGNGNGQDGGYAFLMALCLLDLGAAQSSIFGSARIFFGSLSRLELKITAQEQSCTHARPYWAYNRPIMPMYEQSACRRVLVGQLGHRECSDVTAPDLLSHIIKLALLAQLFCILATSVP